MPANLSSFQSAVQLVSGANFALFALPRIGQDELDAEERRWASALLSLESASDEIKLTGRQGFSGFQRSRIEYDGTRITIRNFALAISLLAAIYLVWMSARPNDPVDFVTFMTIALGVMPALALAASYSGIRSQIESSRRNRNNLPAGPY